MPTAALRPCTQPGCPQLVSHGRCQTHTRAAMQTYESTRLSSPQRGYNHTWRKLRLMVLREEPLCQVCLQEQKTVPATDVDHIVTLRKGGTNERSNLQSLCHSCHSAKTVSEDGAGWRNTR
jgi:5-methylcytosine-specific restriction protein A